MESSDKITVCDWHPNKSSFLWLMSLLSFICVICSYSFYKHTDEAGGKTISVCLCFLFTVCGIGLLLPSRMAINFSKQKLTRETLFLGRFPVWRKNFQFGEFNAIVLDRREGGDGTADYFVGLNYFSGRKLWVRYFSSVPLEYPCSQAEKLAEQLAHDLQLPINKNG